MAVKNYVYGAVTPTAGLDLVEKQFRLNHRYRNKLVELELERRAACERVIAEVSPETAALKAEAERCKTEYERVLAEARRWNSIASLAAGPVQLGRKVKPTVAAGPVQAVQVAHAKAMNTAAWKAYQESRAAAYKSKAVQTRLKPLSAAVTDGVKAMRAELVAEGLYWANYQMADEAGKDYGKGSPPEYTSYHRTDTHWVAVHFQNKVVTVADLFSGSLTEGSIQDVTRPGAKPNRRFVLLRLRVGGCITKAQRAAGVVDPVATIPVLMHRPLPANAQITWVKLRRERVGTGVKWSVMVTLDDPTPNRIPPGEGEVAFKFHAKDCDDGVEVATWAGSDGRSGRVVIPNEEVGRFTEGERVQSAIDVITEAMKADLANWLSGHDVVLPENPYQSDAKSGKQNATRITGLVGCVPDSLLALIAKKDEVLTPTQAIARIKQWRSPDRFVRLYEQWAEQFKTRGVDAQLINGHTLLWHWHGRYCHLKNWFDHGGRQHTAWRDHKYRTIAAEFRAGYKTLVAARLTTADQIERRDQELKVRGEAWVPPPDNKLKRTAACGRLREVLLEAAEVKYEVCARPKWTADDVLASPDRKRLGLPRPKRVRRKTKSEGGNEAA